MNLILFDFINRRKWWLATYSVAVLILRPGFISLTLPLPLLSFILLQYDIENSVYKAQRIRPVSLQQHALAVWLLIVWLGALISAFCLGLETAWRLWTGIGGLPASWPLIGLRYGLEIGLCALLLLVYSLRPSHPGTRSTGTVFSTLHGVVLGLLIPASVMVEPLRPKDWAHVNFWHGLAIAAVPMALIASWKKVPRLLHNSTPPDTSWNWDLETPWTNFSTTVSNPQGHSGLRMLLMALHGRVLMILFFFGWTTAIYYFFLDYSTDFFLKLMTQQITLMVLVMTCLLPDWFNMRSLRALPLSARSLGLCLLSVPIMNGGLMTGVMLWAGLGDETKPLWYSALALGLGTTGMGAALLTAALHFKNSQYFFLPVLFFMMFFNDHSQWYAWMMVVGLFLLVTSIWLMQRCFWRSSRIYTSRGPQARARAAA